MNKLDVRRSTRYDEDLARWATEQASFLRAGQLEHLDREHLAEEIEDLGSSLESEIESRLDVLVMHLLKWEFQPEKRSNSWRASIKEQRERIERRLTRNPSLRNHPAAVLPGAFALALPDAIRETGLPESSFPTECPYTIQQVLDLSFLPTEPSIASTPKATARRRLRIRGQD
jgi:hypothetical protein